MVLALQRLSLAAAVGDRSGAVEADVVEAAQRLTVAEDDDRVVPDFGREVLSPFCYLLHTADELPRSREDPLALELEVHRIVVEPRRNRRGTRNIGVEGEDERHEVPGLRFEVRGVAKPQTSNLKPPTSIISLRPAGAPRGTSSAASTDGASCPGPRRCSACGWDRP